MACDEALPAGNRDANAQTSDGEAWLAKLWSIVMTILAGSSLCTAQAPHPRIPARLAIYYGYPSLVNGAQGDVERAAAAFSPYDVVVLGDGIEFADHQAGRFPAGDPAEHQKVIQLIAAAKRSNPAIKFYGYVPLGDNQSLKPEQIQERIRLWKPMGVAGIFLDEASYDFKIVTRERQNMAVAYVHDQGLGVLMNGYFLDHLFGTEDKPPVSNGGSKNPKRVAPLLDRRDIFLLESFQISNGEYEDTAHLKMRIRQATEYRRRYGSRIFAITTTSDKQAFDEQKFSRACSTAWTSAIDGFGWGEPNFSASNNLLGDHRCEIQKSPAPKHSALRVDHSHFWTGTNGSPSVHDSGDRSRTLSATMELPEDVGPLLTSSRQDSLITSGAGQ